MDWQDRGIGITISCERIDASYSSEIVNRWRDKGELVIPKVLTYTRWGPMWVGSKWVPTKKAANQLTCSIWVVQSDRLLIQPEYQNYTPALRAKMTDQ